MSHVTTPVPYTGRYAASGQPLVLLPFAEELVKEAFDAAVRRGDAHDGVDEWYRSQTGHYPTPTERRRLWAEHFLRAPLNEDERSLAGYREEWRQRGKEHEAFQANYEEAVRAAVRESHTEEELTVRLDGLNSTKQLVQNAYTLALTLAPEGLLRILDSDPARVLAFAVGGSPRVPGAVVDHLYPVEGSVAAQRRKQKEQRQRARQRRAR